MTELTPKEELMEQMRYLSVEMKATSEMMEYYAGFNEDILQHANELHGASDILDTWINGIDGLVIEDTRDE